MLRKEHRLKVFENRITRQYLYPRGMRTGSGKIFTFNFHSLHHPYNISRVVESRKLGFAGYVARMVEGSNAFIILTAKPTGKRSLRRPRHRYEGKVKISRTSLQPT